MYGKKGIMRFFFDGARVDQIFWNTFTKVKQLENTTE